MEDSILVVSVSFFVGAIFLLLIIVIVAVFLWKCGVRLEKPGNSHSQIQAVLCERVEPQAPSDDAEQGVGGTVAETRHATCSRCSRCVATSSGRPSVQMLGNSRRRSRKANSDPLCYSKPLQRKARCVSLGTELQRKRKMSDSIDFMAPCIGRRPWSLWTRVSSDDSIVFENEHFIIISRDRQKTMTLCQLCGQKRPIPPRQSQSFDPSSASAPHGAHINALQRPTNTSMNRRPASEKRTSQAKQETYGRVQRDCDTLQETLTIGNDSLHENVDNSGYAAKGGTMSDGNEQGQLDMESELGSWETQEDADSDQSMDRLPVNIDYRHIGHAVTATTRTFIFGSSHKSRCPPGNKTK